MITSRRLDKLQSSHVIPVTLNQLLQRQAAALGGKVALSFEGDRRTYADLEHRSTLIANGLISEGLVVGDRVAYLGKNSLDYFDFFFAAVKARLVVVPVNWRLATPEVAYILENAHPKFLLVEEMFAEVAAHAAPVIPRLICGNDADPFGRWLNSNAPAMPPSAADWHEPVLQLYTSGTTGKPKGAVLTHRSLFGLRTEPEKLPEWYRWSSQDVSLIAMPVAHISGTGWGLWTLLHGATGIVAREFDPQAVFDQMVANHINKVMMVPTAMQIAARHPSAKTTDFSFLHYIYYGGSPLPSNLLRECAEVFHCGFVQMYGMTETSGTIVALAPEDHEAGGARLYSVGKALPGVEIKIVDEAGGEAPAGVTGEIAIRGCCNMAEYFEMPEATALAVDSEGWLRSGDAGYLDDQGFLYVRDRVKDMIISGGENIYPAEVENAIHGHPAVADVAVVGVPDEKWGEAVKAFVVLKPGFTVEATDIRAFAAERIARFKLPKIVAFVDVLPRNHSGKLLRRQLRGQ